MSGTTDLRSELRRCADLGGTERRASAEATADVKPECPAAVDLETGTDFDLEFVTQPVVVADQIAIAEPFGAGDIGIIKRLRTAAVEFVLPLYPAARRVSKSSPPIPNTPSTNIPSAGARLP